MRRQLNTITKPLNNHKIPYHWGFPTKIIVTINGVKHNTSTVEEDLELLNIWGIIPNPSRSVQLNHRENTQPSNTLWPPMLISTNSYLNSGITHDPLYQTSGRMPCLLQIAPQTYTPQRYSSPSYSWLLSTIAVFLITLFSLLKLILSSTYSCPFDP